MDPDANLQEQRRLSVKIIEQFDTDQPILPGDAVRLAELSAAMDKWIRTGGFPPADWKLSLADES